MPKAFPRKFCEDVIRVNRDYDSAPRAGVHFFSTIGRAGLSRARGVRAALEWVAWDMKASWVWSGF